MDLRQSFSRRRVLNATSPGLRLDSALAEQAQGPPLNPVEIGLIDPADKLWAPAYYDQDYD
jgi:hypothetical protein